MNYELLLELKNAGFPQKAEDLINEVEYQGKKYTKPTDPTLEELIEACEEGFDSLERNPHDKTWSCNEVDWSDMPLTVGNSPKQAVAKLWLVLNAK